MKKAFTLVELIFVIVIIGVLASIAIPKLSNLSDNAKITAEISTASAVQSTIDAVHAEWITNRCDDWTWGVEDQNISDTQNGLNAQGYPKRLSDDVNEPLKFVVKNAKDWKLDGIKYTGLASQKVTNVKINKPNINDYWEYNQTAGTFTLIEP